MKVRSVELKRIIASHTFNPCDTKSSLRVMAFVEQVLGPQKIKEVLSFTWSCPWEKGTQVIKAYPRIVKFPIFVPSFLSRPGIYKWFETYQIKQNGTTRTILSRNTTFIIEKVEA